MNGLGRKKEDKGNDNQSIFTKETFGVVLILFATLCLVCLITRDAVFSAPGKYVNAFLFGCFGIFAYAVVIFAIVKGIMLVADKKTGLTFKRKALITLAFFLLALIVHVITMRGQTLSYGEYIKTSYLMAENGVKTASGGGLFTALLAYPISSLITDAGTYVIVGIILVATVYFTVKDFTVNAKDNADKKDGAKFKSSFVKNQVPDTDLQIQGEREYPVEGVSMPKATAKQTLFINNPNDFGLKNKRELAKDEQAPSLKIGFSEGGLGVVTSGEDKVVSLDGSEDYKKKLEYIKTPAELDIDALRNNARPSNYTKPQYEKQTFNDNSTSVSDYIPKNNVESTPIDTQNERENEIPFIEHDNGVTVAGNSALERSENFERLYAETPEEKDQTVAPEESDVVFRAVREGRIEEILDEKPQEIEEPVIPFIDESFEEEKQEEQIEQLPKESPIRSERRVRNIFFGEEEKKTEGQVGGESLGFTSRVSADNNLSARKSLNFDIPKEEPAQEEKPPKVVPPINREYFRPPFDLLESYAPPVDAPRENHEERMEIIQRTLEEFHINAIPQSYVQGPAFTRYEIMMPAGVSVKKVLNFDDDLKMRLAAKDGVRIEAPIPGKNLVGVEVANTTKSTVGFREVMEGLSKNPKKGALVFAVGKDIVGNAISYDLAKGPHYLIAGATGSGKSVCLHVMILSLLMRYSPEELKVVLVDPKSVEFRKYEHIPHLLVDEIITEPKRVLALLKWAYDETNRRNDMFTAAGGEISNIDDYNKYIASDTVPKLPRIVFFIDELADLMEACKKDLEQRIRMIAAKSRSAGIHLVLATQRPSVDVITGTIKANLPSRIALKVMNYADSSTILGEGGAEKLLGNGDMLFKDSSMGNYERYQGAYISGREITNVVNYIKEKNTAYFDDELVEFLDNETRPKQEEPAIDGSDGGDDANEVNEFFLKALWLAVNTQTVSISQLQRRFQIGYSRAGGLVDKMERMGFVSGNEGSKARRVLLTREQFEERFGSMPE